MQKTTDAKTDWRLIEALLACAAVRSIYIYGEPGIGKTYAAYHKGRVQRGFYAVTLTEETPASELRGHYLFIGQDTKWHDGPFTLAMREGVRLVVNEITHANPDAWTYLYPVAESMETARLTLPTGETVTPAPGFHLVCTDNEPPERLPRALQDRFDCIVRITEPHPEALALLSATTLHLFVSTRGLKDGRAVSLRECLALERFIPEFGLEAACIAVFGPERGPLIHDALCIVAKSEKGGSK